MESPAGITWNPWPGSSGICTIQFTILTAARSGEVRGAIWKEIDLEKRLWSIPAERMKMRSPHTVPLSQQALAILNRMKIFHGDGGLVFPGIHYPEKPLSEI
jgi:integrase